MIRNPVLLDTGPLVSFLVPNDSHHRWSVEQWKRLRPPLLTCEPVLAEGGLLKRKRCDTDGLFALVERGVIRIEFSIQLEYSDVRALMRRYRNRPMSLADARLVRMSEMDEAATVLTLDSDFLIYRRHANRVIRVVLPE